MKNTILAIGLFLAVLSSTAAQTQTRARRSREGQPPTVAESASARRRVIGDTKIANHAQKPAPQNPVLQNATPSWGTTAIAKTSGSLAGAPIRSERSTNRALQTLDAQTEARVIRRTVFAPGTSEERPIVPTGRAMSSGTTAELPRAGVATTYRVGVGDVLDIRLVNIPSRESTLFTVLKGGLIEYPLLGAPVGVEGLTTDEIAALLSREIKVISNSRLSVVVRDYASHTVMIIGLVENPGRKSLQREATPLYAVLAQAVLRPEAALVKMTHVNGNTESLSLTNAEAMDTLVLCGDVVKVSANPAGTKGFVYVGGDVASPGEKEFRDGMTLTQALLAAGGILRNGKNHVKVARRNTDGFLVGAEYDIQSIEQGKTPDPLLEVGDRIEVSRTL